MPSRMRWLAWCGTNQSMSRPLMPVGRRAPRRPPRPMLDHRVAEDLAALHAQMARRCGSSRGRRRHRAGRGSGRRSADGWTACRGRRWCRCPPPPAARPRRRRRRTARRCRGRSSRGCARRSRRRSPARCAPGRAVMKLSATESAIDEARAHRLHVEGGAPGHAELAPAPWWRWPGRSGRASWSRARSGRGRRRSIPARASARSRGGDREVGGRLAVGGDVALADAGALRDPLVGGVEAAGQLVIGDDLLRADRRRSRRPANARSCRALTALRRRHGGAAARLREIVADLLEEAVRRSCRRRRRSRWRSRTRRSPPWLFTTMPFRPRKIAPL